MNQQVQNFITQSKVKGMPDEQIKQELLNTGYPQTEIDDNFNPTINTYSQKKIIHWKGPVIFFLIITGLIFLIGYLGNALSSEKYIVGRFIIALVFTGIFALISSIIRKIKGKFRNVQREIQKKDNVSNNLNSNETISETKQTGNFSGWFYIIVGIISMAFFNLFFAIAGLIFILNGIFIIKRVSPAKKKIITWATFVLVAIIIVLKVVDLISSGFSQEKTIAVVIVLAVLATLFFDFKRIASGQNITQSAEANERLNESIKKTFGNPRSVIYIAVLIILAIIFGFIAVNYISNITK